MPRWAARTDSNQSDIVNGLRDIPGVSVQTGHDDLLVGFRGKTYWYEIKASEKAKRREGQKLLEKTWDGHYKIVWSLEMILKDMGITE